MTNLIVNYLLNLEGFNSFSLESFLYFITRSFIIPIIFIIAIIASASILLALFSIINNLISKTYPEIIKADVKFVAVLSLILGMIFSVLSVLYPVEERITKYYNKELDQHNLKIEFNGKIQIFKSSKELDSNLVR